jgi:hypothetical protein
MIDIRTNIVSYSPKWKEIRILTALLNFMRYEFFSFPALANRCNDVHLSFQFLSEMCHLQYCQDLCGAIRRIQSVRCSANTAQQET